MKIVAFGIIAALTTAAFSAEAQGDHYVSGYARRDGTYVAPHYQTNPNRTTSDNYSTVGNSNPYTGQPGSKPDTRPAYGSPYVTPDYSRPVAPAYGGTTYGAKPAKACTVYGC
jgi:hypothetical protein